MQGKLSNDFRVPSLVFLRHTLKTILNRNKKVAVFISNFTRKHIQKRKKIVTNMFNFDFSGKICCDSPKIVSSPGNFVNFVISCLSFTPGLCVFFFGLKEIVINIFLENFC